MKPKLGIIAGGGDLPRRIAEACRQSDREYCILALDGQAEAGAFDSEPHAWIRVGAIGEGIQYLRGEAVKELVFAGAVKRPSLAELRPDAYATKVLAKSVMRKGDDGLLRAVMDMLERELGVTFVGADELLSETIAVEGQYGIHAPDETSRADIARGVEVARLLGQLDVGQSVVVQAGMVLGVEAAEGTDQLLQRCGSLRRDGAGGVLVKVSKPQQDRRADLPTIGPDTIESVARAGLSGLAIEAGAALVLDRDEMVARANRLGLFIVGLKLQGT